MALEGCVIFKGRHTDASFFKVTLYGSLAATGVGHMTDVAIIEALGSDKCEIVWCPEIVLPQHPNGMKFEALDQEKRVISNDNFQYRSGET